MTSDVLSDLATSIGHAALTRGHTIAAAESVTAGSIGTALAMGEKASEWFRGSIVAYQTGLKRELLGVTADLVITAECAQQMAEGALRLTGADRVVTVTGVGGPDPEEGKPAGTVFICAGSSGDLRVFEHHLEGEPAQVVESATLLALDHLNAVTAE
jgi:PncC family amidohydrolase